MHLLNPEILAKIEEIIVENADLIKSNNGDEIRKVVMKHCESIISAWHHENVESNLLGDFEFVEQFTKTQIFAAYMDEFIEEKRLELLEELP